MPPRGRFWQGPAVPLIIAAVAALCWMTVATSHSATAALDDRSEYLAVTASSGRGQEEVIWIFDTRTEEIIAVAWDRNAKMMMPLGRRDVSADLTVASGSR